MTNITIATFAEGVKVVQTEPLHQYDYGQILRFVGIDDAMDSSDNYEVHFSNSDLSGSAKAVVGGSSGVIIPDEYLASGADIHAWIYTHTGASDQDEEYTDGRTSYEVIIPVLKRARPSDMPPTPTGRDTMMADIIELQGDVHDINQSITGLTPRVETLEAGATWENVRNSIILTKNTNCSNVTLGAAYKIGKLLFLMIYITPKSGLAAGASVDITYSGFTPKINNDFRLLSGIAGVGMYQGWLVGPNIIRFRFMSGSTAWTTENVAFAGIIPLA